VFVVVLVLKGTLSNCLYPCHKILAKIDGNFSYQFNEQPHHCWMYYLQYGIILTLKMYITELVDSSKS